MWQHWQYIMIPKLRLVSVHMLGPMKLKRQFWRTFGNLVHPYMMVCSPSLVITMVGFALDAPLNAMLGMVLGIIKFLFFFETYYQVLNMAQYWYMSSELSLLLRVLLLGVGLWHYLVSFCGLCVRYYSISTIPSQSILSLNKFV